MSVLAATNAAGRTMSTFVYTVRWGCHDSYVTPMSSPRFVYSIDSNRNTRTPIILMKFDAVVLNNNDINARCSMTTLVFVCWQDGHLVTPKRLII